MGNHNMESEAKVIRTECGDFRVSVEDEGFLFVYDGKVITRTDGGEEKAMDYLDVPQRVLFKLFNGLHLAIRREAAAITARIRAEEAERAAAGGSHVCKNEECNSVQAEGGLCRTCGCETRPL